MLIQHNRLKSDVPPYQATTHHKLHGTELVEHQGKEPISDQCSPSFRGIDRPLVLVLSSIPACQRCVAHHSRGAPPSPQSIGSHDENQLFRHMLLLEPIPKVCLVHKRQVSEIWTRSISQTPFAGPYVNSRWIVVKYSLNRSLTRSASLGWMMDVHVPLGCGVEKEAGAGEMCGMIAGGIAAGSLSIWLKNAEVAVSAAG